MRVLSVYSVIIQVSFVIAWCFVVMLIWLVGLFLFLGSYPMCDFSCVAVSWFFIYSGNTCVYRICGVSFVFFLVNYSFWF